MRPFHSAPSGQLSRSSTACAQGDTLTDVAWRLGIDLDTIVNNNAKLADADRIRIGDELLVLPISGLLYQVEQGDTLASIADKYGLDVDPILEFNTLDEDSAIGPGMELVLPGAGPVYAKPTQLGPARIFVPYRSQLDRTPWAGANCGPTALGMGLASMGIDVSSTELRRQVLNAQGMWGNNVGSLMDALARVASNYGAKPIGLFDGNGIARWSLDDVRSQIRAGRPVIVQVRFRSLPGAGRGELLRRPLHHHYRSDRRKLPLQRPIGFRRARGRPPYVAGSASIPR